MPSIVENKNSIGSHRQGILLFCLM